MTRSWPSVICYLAAEEGRKKSVLPWFRLRVPAGFSFVISVWFWTIPANRMEWNAFFASRASTCGLPITSLEFELLDLQPDVQNSVQAVWDVGTIHCPVLFLRESLFRTVRGNSEQPDWISICSACEQQWEFLAGFICSSKVKTHRRMPAGIPFSDPCAPESWVRFTMCCLLLSWLSWFGLRIVSWDCHWRIVRRFSWIPALQGCVPEKRGCPALMTPGVQGSTICTVTAMTGAGCTETAVRIKQRSQVCVQFVFK